MKEIILLRSANEFSKEMVHIDLCSGAKIYIGLGGQ
jgi:hypothetical protein